MRTDIAEADELFRLQTTALKAAANAITMTDCAGAVLWVNPAFTALTGYTADEIIGRNPRVLKSGAHDDAFYRQLWQTILSGGTWRGEITNRRKDGSFYIVEQTITPVRSEAGTITHFVGIMNDITERKRVEETLRQNEERSRTLVDASIDGIWEWDITTNVVAWSDRVYKMFRLTSGTVQPTLEMINDLCHPDDRAHFAEALRAHLEGGQPYDIELRFRRADGAYGFYEWRGQALRDAGGRPRRMIGSISDITEGKQAEEALSAQAFRYKTLIEFCNDSIHILDLNGDLVEANAAFLHRLGYTEAELKGLNVADWDANWNREELRERLRAMLDSNAVFETKHRRKDGSIFDVEASVAGVRVNGQALFFCATRDITERKRAEAALRESNERFAISQKEMELLLQSTGEGIYSLDLEGRCTLINKAALEMTRYAADEVLGHNIHELIHHHRSDGSLYPMSECRILCTAMSGEPCNCDTEVFWRKDGTSFPVRFSSHPILEAGLIKGTVVIFSDITEKKALEARLMRNQRLESIGTLAGGIAHDLNNVLAPILMSLEILGLKFTDPESQKFLATIATSAQRGADLVKQVLTFSRGVQGERTSVQLRHLVREMHSIVQQTFPKTIQMSVQAPKDLWPVNGDATQLHQVLMNLCVNARDAMPKGGLLTLTAKSLQVDEAYVRMNPDARPGPYIVLSVSDTGTGIPRDIQDRIFEPFFTTKELGKGTGLGLSTVLGIVKSHGGFVTVHSEAGQGTRFDIYLPAEPSSQPRPVESGRAALPMGHGELVLVADDEPAVREISRQTLERHGYRVVLAEDGVGAVAMAALHAQDLKLLITDAMMPNMDGREATRAVRILVPKVRVIAASGFASDSNEPEAQGAEADAILRKPFTAETLLRAVGELLNRNSTVRDGAESQSTAAELHATPPASEAETSPN